jgi:hypothetical protein
MRRLTFLAVLLAILFLSAIVLPPVAAQNDKPPCDPGAVIKKAAALTASGDATKDLAALLALQADISAANVACAGMTFKGTDSKVLTPFVLPKGKYKVSLTWPTTDSFLVDISAISPDYCAIGVLNNTKKETIVTSRDDKCKVAIEVSAFGDSTSQWVIAFEPLQ